MSKNHLLTGIVPILVEAECSLSTKKPSLDRPTGEATRNLANVLLRVAAVHAQRVQLHELPCVILVRRFFSAELVVQVSKHCRAVSRGPQHVGKLAQRMIANDRLLVHRLPICGESLSSVNVEMVRPKVDHALVHLIARINGTQERGLVELSDQKVFVDVP
jgi:hypothetical protein